MKKIVLSVTVLSLLVFLGGASLFGKPNAQDSSSAQTSKSAAKPAVKATHPTAHHAKRAGPNYTAKYAAGTQSLSGTLSMVDSQQRVIVVTNSEGTPFNFRVMRGTRIMVGGKKGTLDDLSGQKSQQVSVKYRDHMNAGLVAQVIDAGS